MNAEITDIKRFAIHDGDGIRTTVFFKGCPLKCVWCHNPETIGAKPQLAFYEHKCKLCGNCVNVCENHTITGGKHIVNRKNCVFCNKCVEVCPSKALIIYGKQLSCDEICRILLQDKEFYEVSGGGITLSGGECLLQPDACSEILKNIKKEGINTAVDTCGDVPFESIKKVIEYTDTFLYDIKAINEGLHKKCTGASNVRILDNLKKIDNAGGKIEIRVPFVPEYNDIEMKSISETVANIKNLVKVRILPYHDFAKSKYMSLGMNCTLPVVKPNKSQMEQIKKLFRENLTCPVL